MLLVGHWFLGIVWATGTVVKTLCRQLNDVWSTPPVLWNRPSTIRMTGRQKHDYLALLSYVLMEVYEYKHR